VAVELDAELDAELNAELDVGLDGKFVVGPVDEAVAVAICGVVGALVGVLLVEHPDAR
jgi:hypothetical protein